MTVKWIRCGLIKNFKENKYWIWKHSLCNNYCFFLHLRLVQTPSPHTYIHVFTQTYRLPHQRGEEAYNSHWTKAPHTHAIVISSKFRSITEAMPIRIPSQGKQNSSESSSWAKQYTHSECSPCHPSSVFKKEKRNAERSREEKLKNLALFP